MTTGRINQVANPLFFCFVAERVSPARASPLLNSREAPCCRGPDRPTGQGGLDVGSARSLGKGGLSAVVLRDGEVPPHTPRA